MKQIRSYLIALLFGAFSILTAVCGYVFITNKRRVSEKKENDEIKKINKYYSK